MYLAISRLKIYLFTLKKEENEHLLMNSILKTF